MNKKIEQLFEQLWKNYISVTPTAFKIHELLKNEQNSQIINDHIALRTFNLEKVNLEKLALPFKALGYHEAQTYHFKQKKLLAKHYEHEDSNAPKVFISQLLLEEFNTDFQQIIKMLVSQIDKNEVFHQNFIYSGRHWNIDSKTYEKLLSVSEYAAWMYVWGYRANHFTVSINALKGYDSLESVNKVLLDAGIELNSAGGYIKGSPEVFLEQSSTLADEILVEFNDKSMMVPSCFYEFALRYEKEGELYSGFVEASANKIFESTNKR